MINFQLIEYIIGIIIMLVKDICSQRYRKISLKYISLVGFNWAYDMLTAVTKKY